MKYTVRLDIVSRIGDGRDIKRGGDIFLTECGTSYIGEWSSPALPRIGEELSIVIGTSKSSFGVPGSKAVVKRVQHIPVKGAGEKIVVSINVFAEIIFEHSYVEISDGRVLERSSNAEVVQDIEKFMSNEGHHFDSVFLPAAKSVGLREE